MSAGGDAPVPCAPSAQRFRYVIVHGAHEAGEAICLGEVRIYERSKWQPRSAEPSLRFGKMGVDRTKMFSFASHSS